jgi:hypothetical protein
VSLLSFLCLPWFSLGLGDGMADVIADAVDAGVIPKDLDSVYDNSPC